MIVKGGMALMVDVGLPWHTYDRPNFLSYATAHSPSDKLMASGINLLFHTSM